ncbi:LuxR family transcriptional regulator [Arthrobacter sp. SDTb3-6]|uniref:helix-turn-helix transcriptional regulator n=1 Tax=Arthrobacter sp. SDTb3-6 TaxID=2713571 RepID=UPI00159D4349|nr:LuxR family transcriptional regulator [Arthrobacter sp. SDTb3-6]NVM97298.1 LuxR family transcriptional regulator [Arthrobacter sp. SDTb3-6]
MHQQRSQAFLARLLHLAESGAAQLVVVRGPAGCGKSTLVRRFLDTNKHLATWNSAGARWESGIPGSALQELLPPAPEAPDVALGDRLLAFLQEAGKHTGILVVENLQWTDGQSLAALLFAWRRLRAEKLLLVLTLREEEAAFMPHGARELLEAAHGTTLELEPPTPAGLQEIAASRLGAELSAAAADQLLAYTAGNIETALELIRENPGHTWNQLNQRFPAPRAVAAEVAGLLETLSVPARTFIEAAAVLGRQPRLDMVVALSAAGDPLPLIEECVSTKLVEVAGSGGNHSVRFSGHIHQMAVYHLIPLSRRLALHAAAAALGEFAGDPLAHRADATLLSDPGLAHQLESRAQEQSARGEWSSAAASLHRAAQLATDASQRGPLLLRAVDATVAAGELPRALSFAGELAAMASSPTRDLLSGYIAILQGRSLTADRWLTRAWAGAEQTGDTELMATVAQRRVLHSLGRLEGDALVEWAERTAELSAPESTLSVEASAIQGLGLGMLGRRRAGEDILTRMLSALPSGAQRQRAEMAMGWLHVAGDQIETARHELANSSSTDFSEGSHRIALWARAWLARAHYAAGDWDQALETLRTGIALQEKSGIELMRPLLHLTAVQIHSMRGEPLEVEGHLAKAWARTGSYEVMQVPYRMARAEAARARADYDEVILALEPLLAMDRSHGIDEPGFWPWHDVYADALVRKERLDEAGEFLAPLLAQARKRRHRSSIARLLVVRAQLLAARGDLEGTHDCFEEALTSLQGLTLPVVRANVEYSYGQSLRRAGKRGDAVGPLTRALAGYTQLGATIYIERCNRELQATGISVPRRDTADWSTLTAQEKAVAALVCAGASNRKAAEELFIGTKTVQYHLTRIYAKLGVASRTELAARYRDSDK